MSPNHYRGPGRTFAAPAETSDFSKQKIRGPHKEKRPKGNPELLAAIQKCREQIFPDELLLKCREASPPPKLSNRKPRVHEIVQDRLQASPCSAAVVEVFWKHGPFTPEKGAMLSLDNFARGIELFFEIPVLTDDKLVTIKRFFSRRSTVLDSGEEMHHQVGKYQTNPPSPYYIVNVGGPTSRLFPGNAGSNRGRLRVQWDFHDYIEVVKDSVGSAPSEEDPFDPRELSINEGGGSSYRDCGSAGRPTG